MTESSESVLTRLKCICMHAFNRISRYPFPFSQYLSIQCNAAHHAHDAHACVRAVELRSHDEAAQGHSLCVGSMRSF